MLRRKLLLKLGSLVLLLVVATAASLWMLERLLRDMDHVQNHAAVLVEDVGELGMTITGIELTLYDLELERERHLDPLIEGVEALRRLVDRLERDYVIQGPEGRAGYSKIRAQLPEFEGHIGSLATTRDQALAEYHTHKAMELSVSIRGQALLLGQVARHHAQEEREALVSRFRWVVLGLCIIFLLVIDLAVMILWRTASMVLRPMDRLIRASRELAQEHFDHRVALDQKDEFDELARAHNRLAEELQAREAHKVEVLAQVARTLNHELNNAMAVIQLQLTLLQDNVDGAEGTEKCLRQIRESLERMTRTVQSLKQIRRVVLTEYPSGEKMLDLERSVRDEGAEPAPPAPAKSPRRSP